ncbi:MAG: DUF3293 domain-containing protein [Polynucleobacter victoriensis]
MLNKIYVSEITYGETYKNAEYQVSTLGGWIAFKIGEHNQHLDQLLDANRVDMAALITAWNPQGKMCEIKANHQANQSLELAIQEMGLPYYFGFGSDPKGAWKEDSYLVMGIGLSKARELGDAYQQNAIVWINKGEAPSLIWLR